MLRLTRRPDQVARIYHGRTRIIWHYVQFNIASRFTWLSAHSNRELLSELARGPRR